MNLDEKIKQAKQRFKMRVLDKKYKKRNRHNNNQSDEEEKDPAEANRHYVGLSSSSISGSDSFKYDSDESSKKSSADSFDSHNPRVDDSNSR